jgi:hypothetical protein
LTTRTRSTRKKLPAGGSDRRVGGVPKDLIRALLLLEREVRKVLLLREVRRKRKAKGKLGEFDDPDEVNEEEGGEGNEEEALTRVAPCR